MGSAHGSMTMMADGLDLGRAAPVTARLWRVTGNLNTHDGVPTVWIVIFQIVRAVRHAEHSFPGLNVCCERAFLPEYIL